MLDVRVKYFTDIEPLEQNDRGDWIDLRAAEDVYLKKGESKLIPLGVGMVLPAGLEAHVVPRSSTYKKWHILQTNHMGVIDNSFSGDEDQWKFPALAIEDTVIRKGDRICQFRLVASQPKLNFITTDHLNEESRGGFGSSGTN